jgi:hypothetical protein
MPKHTLKYILLTLLATPSVSLAFSLAGSTFKTTVTYLVEILNILVPILIGCAFIVFFWGLSKFILNSSKPEKIKEGKEYMMWGILVLFILLTYKTIIGLVSSDLGFGSGIPDISNILETNAK